MGGRVLGEPRQLRRIASRRKRSRTTRRTRTEASSGKTVTEERDAWEKWWYTWLGERATHAFSSSLRRHRLHITAPHIDLTDLPESSRVLQRAQMFTDIAMVRVSQRQIGGVTGGVKSRCRRTMVASIGKTFSSSRRRSSARICSKRSRTRGGGTIRSSAS